MTIFYKATRPDGTDFRTGTVDYASICGTGESLPELPGGACCTDGVYHASINAADTLTGGFWPCRLFEVEGEAVAEEGNKRGFKTLQVVRELPAWQALGPNGEAVVQLIEKAKGLTLEQAEALNAAWDAAWRAAWEVAWHAARHAARDAASNAARHAARHAAWDAADYAAWEAAWEATRHAARYAARHAAWNAAEALVVRDLITKEQFNILAGPWISVMGPL